jgi:hypothetical protein
MLDPGHFKAYLAFDFGAESGRAVLGHLPSASIPTAFMCNAKRRTGADVSVTDPRQSVLIKWSVDNGSIHYSLAKCIAVPQRWRNHPERHAI